MLKSSWSTNCDAQIKASARPCAMIRFARPVGSRLIYGRFGAHGRTVRTEQTVRVGEDRLADSVVAPFLPGRAREREVSQLPAGGHAGLAEDTPQVRIDGAWAQEERCSDLL